MPRLQILLGAVVTLCGCGVGYQVGYQIENGKPVFVRWNEAVGRFSSPLEDADASTFKVLAPEKFAKDSRHVFYEAAQIEDANVESFVPLKDKYQEYSKDKYHVYMRQFVIADADPKSFQLLTFPFSRDHRHVFCGTELVPTDDVDKFQVLLGSAMLMMSGDIEPNNDEDTRRKKRKINGNGWATDGTFIFCGARKVEGADCESFRAQDEFQANDKNRSYSSLDSLIGDVKRGDANQEENSETAIHDQR